MHAVLPVQEGLVGFWDASDDLKLGNLDARRWLRGVGMGSWWKHFLYPSLSCSVARRSFSEHTRSAFPQYGHGD